VGSSIACLIGIDLRFRLKAATKAGNHLHMTTSISEHQKLAEKFKSKIRLVQSERAATLKELEQKHFIPAKVEASSQDQGGATIATTTFLKRATCSYPEVNLN
jgi:hypothetical protein